jgi:hypothetical protein
MDTQRLQRQFLLCAERTQVKVRAAMDHTYIPNALRVYPKVSGLSHKEINNKSKHLLRSNTKDYGGKTH